MQRHTFALQIKTGEIRKFRSTLGAVWPEVKEIFDTYDLRNFSLWSIDYIIFGYYESNDDFEMNEEFLAEVTALDQRFEGCYDWLSEPGKPMRLMYHAYGGVQEEKELVYKKDFCHSSSRGYGG